MEEKFDKYLFIAFGIVDAFFADILSRVGSKRLYSVTSCLSSIYFDENDGIVYSSVRAKGSPLIVLKTSAVDSKIEHISAECFHILKDYGYAKYYAKKLYTGVVNDSNIKWTKEI